MIVRSWRGWADSGHAGAYPEHFRRTVLPELRRLPGFLRATLLCESQGNEIEYHVLTAWASLDAIRGFAGTDIQRAVVEPQAAAALLRFDQRVHHYEVVEDTA